MLKKIVSGGQTGADQAALDAAMEMGAPHGGWAPRGRKTEAGRLPEKYLLQEMPTASYAARTERNVIDSDGTLILSHGKLKGGSAKTEAFAVKHRRPCLHIDLASAEASEAPAAIRRWLKENGIQVLNVAGPRASEDRGIYEPVKGLVKAVLDENRK